MKRTRRRRHSTRTGGSWGWRFAAVVALGLAATLASSAVRQQTVARYADIDGCVSGCEVVAAGWPLPYIVDHPGLSPAREASLAGAVLGVDRWRPEALALDLALWTALAAILAALLRRLRR